MDLGDPTVRTLDEIVRAFDPDKVVWLFVLLALDFVTGVVNAFKKNVFDWARVFDVAKKNIVIAAAWGAAFVYSENAGNIVYGLALAYIGGSVVANIVSLIGTNATGTLGQLVTKGPGDSTNTGPPG